MLRFLAAGALGAAVLVVTVNSSSGEDKKAPKTLGKIERLDPALDAIVAPGAAMEIVAEGFDWSEGPLWVREGGGYLLFSDIPPNRIHKWTPGQGASVYLNQSGYLGPIPRPNNIAPDEPGSNGLTLDPSGRLVLAQHGNRQVARMDAPLSKPQAKYVPVAAKYSSPNK